MALACFMWTFGRCDYRVLMIWLAGWKLDGLLLVFMSVLRCVVSYLVLLLKILVEISLLDYCS